MVRFGDAAAFGYEEPFPIVCVKIAPKNEKYAEALGHRDYLGAIMSLGIERKNIGDIVVRPPDAYVFVLEKMANFFVRELTEIRRTPVICSVVEALPPGTLFETEERRFTVSSLRIDVVCAAVCRLSRSRIDALFKEKKVFLNSAVCENVLKELSPGDRISVRGFGKFCFLEAAGHSKKGKDVITICIYK